MMTCVGVVIGGVVVYFMLTYGFDILIGIRDWLRGAIRENTGDW